MAPSVVIPAHDEAAVIERCLRTLLEGAEPGEFDVIVACNGCTDDTADRARRFQPTVRVVETSTPGKPVGLNLGDAAAATFPRVYLDADIEVTAGAVRSVCEVLDRGPALAAAPALAVKLEGASRLVRAYYRIWVRLGYASDHLVGAGFYALSAEGRGRFDAFPSVLAEDFFVRSLFEPGERVSLNTERFVMRPPRDLRTLLDIRARRTLGNLQMRADRPTERQYGRERQGLIALVRSSPRLLPSALVYAGVHLAALARARARLRAGETAWTRDASSRVEGP